MNIQLKQAHITIGKRCILKDVTFQLHASDFIHLNGSNGSGKTVFLESLMGFYRLTHGQRISCFNQKSICYIADTAFFHDYETVYEVMLSYVYFYNIKISTVKEIMNLLHFDSTVNFNQKIATLSKGTKKKLQLIPLFISHLDLFILDEIMNGLDFLSLELVLLRLKTLHKEKSTVILTEHNPLIVDKLYQFIPNIQEALCVDQNILLKSSF